MDYSDFIIYVDESGDHDLTQVKSPYPIFSLAFCIFNKKRYVDEVVPRLQDLKFRWFGHDAIVLHEREIRKRERPFEVLYTKAANDAFMAELGKIVADAPMTVISAVIHKDNHKSRYAVPANPYELALRFCIERAVLFLKDLGQSDKLTHIIVECRGKNEDEGLELEFRRICDGQNFVGKIDCLDILFVDKKANSSGLQIADLIARPIGLKALRPNQTNRAYEVIETKFRRSQRGSIEGYGIKIFP
ncbi:DUF3800 domain-containing protein [Sneathiella chungangensis]|uniref:DUF3800 domain-containing protein n=1 Tax=Sneathiella chungangensis TaxID=1418234 RepID=A0A845MJ69_9PROT|nr:DUF3800 domain-containing protein [Sneathiella chungangensis]MZR24113.1 DUF3800 domain-containing protein [Sneathiella chungangensis]